MTTNTFQPSIRSGVPSLGEYLSLLDAPLFMHLEQFSNAFLNKHRKKLFSYGQRWSRDPLHQWSRQWEYPYTYAAISNLLALSPRKDCQILDAGSGVTFFPFLIANDFSGSTVHCCDYDQTLTRVYGEICKAAKQPVQFNDSALDELPYANEAFDIIYCISVLEHTDKYDIILKEFQRVLKPNGLLVLTFDVALDDDGPLNPEGASELVALIQSLFVQINGQADDLKVNTSTHLDLVTTHEISKLNRTRGLWNYSLSRRLKTYLCWRRPVKPADHRPKLTFVCSTWRKT